MGSRLTEHSRLGVLVLIVVLLALLPSTTTSAAAPRGVLRVAAQADFTGFDPVNTGGYQPWIMVLQMFNGLYNLDRRGLVVPDLAEGLPRISGDGKVYTIQIRQGVKFHNGREVEAADFKYSLERVLDPTNRSWGARFFRTVAGAADFSAGKVKEVTGIRVLDKRTLQITLDTAQAVFIYSLAISPGFVVPKEEVERRGEQWTRFPVGTGPYKFVEWVSGQRAAFEINQDYFGRKPTIQRIEYQLGVDPQLALLRLERGDVDVLNDGVPPAELARIRQDARYKDLLASGTQYGHDFLAISTQIPPLDRREVRRAIAMAIDRDRIVTLIQGAGVRADTYLPPGIPGRNSRVRQPSYSPDGARELLQKAGLPSGFTTELVYSFDNATHAKIAPALQRMLGEVGIYLRLKPVTTATRFQLIGQPKTVQMSLASGGANFADPFSFLSTHLCVNAGPGTSSPEYYCNPRFDKLIEQAETITDNPERRYKLYEEAEAMLMEDSIRVVLWNPVMYTLHSRRVKDFYVHPIFRWYWRDYRVED